MLILKISTAFSRTINFCVSLTLSSSHFLHRSPITWLVLAEIFPAKVKGKAMGLATTANRCTSFIAALTFLTMCDKLKWGGTFYVYAGFAGFALVFYALLVPETTGLPLELITPKFAKPMQMMRDNLAELHRMLNVRRPASSHVDKQGR
mgnify:CR=1 FL=1